MHSRQRQNYAASRPLPGDAAGLAPTGNQLDSVVVHSAVSTRMVSRRMLSTVSGPPIANLAFAVGEAIGHERGWHVPGGQRLEACTTK
ncbi:hypothetical protein ABIC60_004849 [Phyllobacterium ifriqiyense]